MKANAWFMAVCVALACAAGCKEDKTNVPADAAVDAGPADASCFNNPITHDEIMNACTDAQKIYKDSHPPLLNADGTVPALP